MQELFALMDDYLLSLLKLEHNWAECCSIVRDAFDGLLSPEQALEEICDLLAHDLWTHEAYEYD